MVTRMLPTGSQRLPMPGAWDAAPSLPVLPKLPGTFLTFDFASSAG
jgi:hypothetical protein